jgi:hypothetical protein
MILSTLLLSEHVHCVLEKIRNQEMMITVFHEDVLNIIFEFTFETIHDVNQMLLVNKQWRDTVYEGNSKWFESYCLYLDDKYSCNLLCNSERYSRQLKQLCITVTDSYKVEEESDYESVVDISDILTVFSNELECLHVKNILIFSEHIGIKSQSHLFQSITSCRELRILYLEDLPIDSGYSIRTRDKIKALHKLIHLEELSFRNCNLLRRETILSLFSSDSFPCLTSLNLEGCNELDTLTFSMVITKLKRLVNLNISGTCFDSDRDDETIIAIDFPSCLKRLQMKGCFDLIATISLNNFESFSGGNIIHLDISQTNVDNAMFIQLVNQLLGHNCNRSITLIVFRCRLLTPDTIQNIVTEYPSLQILFAMPESNSSSEFTSFKSNFK